MTIDEVKAALGSNAAFGPSEVKPLGTLMANEDFELARSAGRALWKLVHRAGAPGKTQDAQAVVSQLLGLLSSGPVQVRREALWMLSAIAGEEAVAPMAALLSDKDLREDARCALQRIPGPKATEALQKALDGAPDDFKTALADSIRRRGKKVRGYPSQKLVPTRRTELKKK